MIRYESEGSKEIKSIYINTFNMMDILYRDLVNGRLYDNFIFDKLS